MPRRFIKTFNTMVIAVIIGLQISVLITYWYFTFYQKGVAAQGIRETIFYQGKIANANNVPPASGNYNMQFLIYDAPTAGNLLWTEVWDGTNQGESGSQVNINNGIFAVELNSLCGNWQGGCASNGGVNFNTDALYLEVQFDSDTNGTYEEIFSPRKRLTAIPYALNADKLDGVDTGTSGTAIPVLSNNNVWSGIQTIQPGDPANQGLIIKGASGQTGNLQEWQTSSGTVLASLSATGALSVSSFETSELTSNQQPSGGIPLIGGSAVGYWKFDDLTGSTAADATVNNLDGTITGAAFVSGYFGYTGDYALSFDGSDDVQIPDNDALDGFDGLTFETWIKTSTAGTIALANKFKHSATITDDAYKITLVNGVPTVTLGGNSTSATVATGSIAVNDDAWHHIAYVFDKPTSYLYVDGIYDDAATYAVFNNTLHNSSDNLYLGAANSDGTLTQQFLGTMENPVLYNIALSASTIQTHFNDGSGSGVAFVLDTQQEFVGSDAKLLSVRNNGEEKAYFSNDGTLTLPQLNTTGQSLFTLGTDTQALIIKASEGQTANLVEWKSSGGTTLSSIDAEGILSTSAISSRQLVSNATESGSAPALDESFNEGYWKFDEGTGSTLADETANGLDGTLTAATWAGAGYFGYVGDDALTFDGSSSYAAVAHNTALDPGAGGFTVEAWVKPTAYGSGTGGWNDTIVAKHTTDFTNGYALIADNTADLPEFKVSDGVYTASAVGASQLTLDTWYHIAGVWDATAKVAYLYVNGELTGSDGEISMGAISSSSDLEIGRYNHTTQSRYDYFTGSIDTVIVSSKALSGSEVSLHYSDGASVGLSIDTAENFVTSGSKLLSLRNNGSEKISFDKDGSITSSGQVVLSLGSDIRGLRIIASSSQTKNLQEWTDSSGQITSFIDNAGQLSSPSVTVARLGGSGGQEGTAPVLESSAVGYWKFDENTGTALTDETVNTNNATGNNTTWAALGQYGYSGDYALEFDGATAYVTTPVTLTGDTNPFSFETWFKTTAINTSQEIAAQNDGTNKLFRLVINELSPNELTFRLFGNLGGTSDISAPIAANQWHHVVALYTGTSQELYLDGKRINSVVITETPSATQTATLIMGRAGDASSNYFSGGIDNPVVYNQALNRGIIVAHYTTGRAGRALVIDTDSTLAAGKLLTVNNNGVERLSVDYAGAITSSGMILRQLTGQTGNIFEVQDDTGVVLGGIDVTGAASFAGLQTTGKFVGKRTTVASGSYTAAADDYIIEVNYGGAAVISLPTAVGIEGQMYSIKDVSGGAGINTITIDPDSSETVDGAATVDITTDYGTVTVYSDGANWFIL